jgi:hypothetical protein
VALKHRGAVAVELVFERRDHSGMVVADVVDAVSGNEIQDASPVDGVEFCANAAHVLDVHLQDIEQPCPLRVHVSFVERFVIRREPCFWHQVLSSGRSGPRKTMVRNSLAVFLSSLRAKHCRFGSGIDRSESNQIVDPCFSCASRSRAAEKTVDRLPFSASVRALRYIGACLAELGV